MYGTNTEAHNYSSNADGSTYESNECVGQKNAVSERINGNASIEDDDDEHDYHHLDSRGFDGVPV